MLTMLSQCSGVSNLLEFHVLKSEESNEKEYILYHAVAADIGCHFL